MAELGKLRKKEQHVVSVMVELYCNHNHGTHAGALCPECDELLTYALARIEHCRHGEQKTFCASCKTPCYAPEKREQIRAVMRWAGPRMLRYHPVLACWHLARSLREKRV